MTRTKNTYLALLAVLLSPMAANAGFINISFEGLVDESGATIGGVSAPIGSLFSLDITIDDSNAGIGSYAITGISYTTVVGTYNTVSNWLNPLIATQVGPSITLALDPVFEVNATTEHFLLNLSNFGSSLFDNPLSWSGDAIVGDIIVRGIGGFSSLDQLSGIRPFTGTLAVSAVPEPGTLALFGIGLLGIGAARRRKRA